MLQKGALSRGGSAADLALELPAHNAGQGFLDQIKHHMDSEQPAQMDIATIAAAMGMTMLGQPQPWLCGLEALMESSTIRLFRDNQLIQQACALSSMSGPEEAGEWMLERIQNHKWPLTAGTLLMTGTCGDAIPFQPGSYRADYGPLGQIEFSIE